MPKSISQASQDEARSAVLFKKNIPAVPFPSSSVTGSIFKAQLQVTTTEKNNTEEQFNVSPSQLCVFGEVHILVRNSNLYKHEKKVMLL